MQKVKNSFLSTQQYVSVYGNNECHIKIVIH